MRNKTEQGEMVGMLEDLRAFPHFPKELFLSVTGGEVDDADDQLTLEHWPKDIREGKDGLWRDFYTGEELENYNETWGKNNVGKYQCATVMVGNSNESLIWSKFPCSTMHYGLRPIERGQFRFFRFCMKISLSLSNSMIFSFSPLLKTRKKC